MIPNTKGQNMFKLYSVIFSIIFMITSQAQVLPGGGVSGDGGGPKQSWGEIINNPNLRPAFPSHNIQGRTIKFNHLCSMGERIRTKYKQIVGNSFQQNSKIIFDYLVVDRVREERVCVERQYTTCLEWETVKVVIPYEEKIEVYKRKENSNEWKLAFEKMFELPECKLPLP